ncbi:MAG: M3 family oligoendopeptidase [Anaerolineae bacterium]|nr:M3 family oligoendopeptidase [Anaerolineae bacterium]
MTTIVDKKLTGAEAVRWDLSSLYTSPDDPQIEQEMADSLSMADAFADKYRGKVASLSAEELRQAVEDFEQIVTLLIKLGSYAYLTWSTDTQNPTLGKLMAKSQEHGNQVNQKILFFELEWSTAPDEAEKLADSPVLEKYRHYLKVERLNKPYLRSESEEQIMSELSMTGSSAWNRYFGEVTSNWRFPWGDEMVTQSEILDKLKDPERDIRRRAADSLTGVLRQNLHATTFVFNMILLEKYSKDKIRGYKTWISARNLSNQIQDEAVDALIDACTSRYDIVARYYRLLGRLLGYDELYDYDRYAPLENKVKEVAWHEAQETVLNAFGGFDERMAKIAEKFFVQRWIDAPPQPGKRGGAYSHPTSAAAHPYVFMNYTGKVDSVMTLAHELGHGVHQYLSAQRGDLQKSTPLTTAEMASTFGEMLVFDYLIARETDPEVRLGMRMEKISSTFATVFRQISMNRFEDAIHNARRGQGELSTDQLSEFWLNTQRPMFGDSLTLRDDYGIWWSYVPHFLATPGYVYAYAFGELLVWALYARYQSGLKNFNEKYLDALAMGGSDWPHHLLAPLDVNLQDPQFWHEGLGLLDQFVAETEADAKKVRG